MKSCMKLLVMKLKIYNLLIRSKSSSTYGIINIAALLDMQ